MRRWLLAAAVISGACGSGSGDPISGPTEDTTKTLIALAPIEEVQVTVGRSPTTVVAHVRGYLPDPCWTRTDIDQQWHGNWVNVWIVMRRPTAAQCVQVTQPFELDIPVPGSFPPGTYIIRVNGVGQYIQM